MAAKTPVDTPAPDAPLVQPVAHLEAPVKVTFRLPHTHAGVAYGSCDTATVSQFQAAKLARLGVIKE